MHEDILHRRVIKKALKISEKIDKANEIIGSSVSWLALVTVILTFIITVMRYVFNQGSILWQEMVMYLHSALFLLVAALALQKNIHVRIDIFYANFSQKKKALVNIFGTLFMLFPFTLLCFILSWDYVISSWAYYEGSQETGGLDAVYILKSLLLIMPVLLFFQGISELIKETGIYTGLIEREDNTKTAFPPTSEGI